MKSFKHLSYIYIIFAIVFCFSLNSYAESTTYVWSNNETSVESTNELNLESGAAILIEQHSGQVLYSHNIHEQLRPASVTKIMSVLLIMEQINMRKTLVN